MQAVASISTATCFFFPRMFNVRWLLHTIHATLYSILSFVKNFFRCLILCAKNIYTYLLVDFTFVTFVVFRATNIQNFRTVHSVISYWSTGTWLCRSSSVDSPVLLILVAQQYFILPLLTSYCNIVTILYSFVLVILLWLRSIVISLSVCASVCLLDCLSLCPLA